MSLGSQMRGLQSLRAAFLQDAFGTNADGASVTFDYDHGAHPAVPGYYSPMKTRQPSEQAGFVMLHDAVVRFSKSAGFTPEIDKLILIVEGATEILLRIDEIAGSHPLSPEWVLGCKAQN